MKAKVLFLGTPDFAIPSLTVMHQHVHVVGVITQPDRPFGRKRQLKPSPVGKKASALNLRVFKCVSPQDVSQDVQALKADCALVVAYGQILKQAFLELFPLGVVNLHASLLPRWRGAAPIQRALMAGDPVTGVCLQKVVRKLDAGPVLGQVKYDVPKDIMADQLTDLLSHKGAKLVEDIFLKYLRGDWQNFKEQETSLVTYASKIYKEEGLLDLREPAENIFNKYRGLCVWPGVWVRRGGKILKIRKMLLKKSLKGKAGLVIKATSEGITIACGKGAIQALKVQPESRSCMTAREYINGYNVKEGEIWQ